MASKSTAGIPLLRFVDLREGKELSPAPNALFAILLARQFDEIVKYGPRDPRLQIPAHPDERGEAAILLRAKRKRMLFIRLHLIIEIRPETQDLIPPLARDRHGD